MKLIATLTLCLLCSACLNEGKVTAWNERNKEQAAKYCADKFPPIITTETTYITKIVDSTKYKEAEVRVMMYYDTLYKHDTLFRNKWKYILSPCLDTPKVIVRTVVDSANMYLKEQEAKRMNETITEKKQQVKWLLFALLIASIFVIIKLKQ